MQHAMDVMSSVYHSLGLVINAQKTEVLFQERSPSPTPPMFTISGVPLKLVNLFCYLGSILTSTWQIDDDIHGCINLPSSAFGRLRSHVFDNNHLRTSTKVAVYRAVCVLTLLYGAEAWINTTYRYHIRRLDAFNIRFLQHILGITWQDHVPHTNILHRTESISIEVILAQRQLWWVGHIIRMPGCCLPRQVLYVQLLSASRKPGGQKQWFKDQLKGTLKWCNITWRRVAPNNRGSGASEDNLTLIQYHPSLLIQASRVLTVAGCVAPGSGFIVMCSGIAASNDSHCQVQHS
ncbi:hypothetical protein ABVT39_010638, partial [Epinephelus coioides]